MTSPTWRSDSRRRSTGATRRLPAGDRRLLEAAVQAAPRLPAGRAWDLRVAADHLELIVDPHRHCSQADPEGRQACLGAGAGLACLGIATERLGYLSRVRLLPDHDRPRLLARVELGGQRPQRTRPSRMYAAMRGLVITRPATTVVPHQALVALAETAQGFGVVLAAPDSPASERELRALLAHEGVSVDGDAEPATVMALETAADHPRDWLRSGQALARVLLLAHTLGLGVTYAPLPPRLRRGSLRAGYAQVVIGLTPARRNRHPAVSATRAPGRLTGAWRCVCGAI